MPGKAPVEKVGGTQADGPWPEGVSEVVEGEQYDRPVELADGSVQTLTVTVTEVRQIGDTDGYVVTYEHDDPTADGGVL